MSDYDRYGRFDEAEGCFVLTEEPPRKWRNVHYNGIGDWEYACEVSNLGDGYSTVRDRDGNQCLLVGYDHKFLYIRDETTGTVFCPWGAPAPQAVTDRSVRYYPAKTEIRGTCCGLRATHRVFVPSGRLFEVHTLVLENLTDRPKPVSVFFYALFQLTGTDREGRFVGKENYAEVKPEIAGVLVTNNSTLVPHDRYKGFVTVLRGFVGGNGYRDQFLRSEYAVGTPRILWGWNCTNEDGMGPDCAGVVQAAVTVPPGGRERLDILLGQTSGLEEVRGLRASLTPELLDAACEEQMAAENRRREGFTLRLGHPHYDSLYNIFVKKQLYFYLINKSGFRDNLQVDHAYAMVDYPVAKANLLRALASQFPSGLVPHGFRPLNRKVYSDKPAWILMVVPGLVKESGDFGLLEERVPYLESDETGTVWDHVKRTVRYMLSDLGPHGLSDQHHADWNDGLEAIRDAGRRESVMVTQQLCYGLREVAELARRLGEEDYARFCEEQYRVLADRLNEVAWDGEWYIRILCEDGYRIGSKTNTEGRIFINSQSWAVISGTAPPDRATLCMDSLEKHLGLDIGYRLCAPPFTRFDPRVGRISNAVPGHVENGGCYNHAAGFKAVADCLLGRAENAWRTFVKMTPDNPDNPVSRSQVEPYCYTNSFSAAKYNYGQAGQPWATGSAAWATILLIEWILGCRRHYDGLLIDPCLPPHIRTARLVRRFRDGVYDITLENPSGQGRGVRFLELDGRTVDGNLIKPSPGTHRLRAVLGDTA